MSTESYSMVDLESNNILARRLKDGETKMGVAESAYKWHEFEQGSTWEFWEDDVTLYYQGEVTEVVAHGSSGYVMFRILGKPKLKPSPEDD